METDISLHPKDATTYLNSDIYRLSVTTTDPGWSAQLANALAAVKFGDSLQLPVHVTHTAGGGHSATITLTATSESDPTKTAQAILRVTVP